MGDKIATSVFWLIAGSLIIFGLIALIGSPFRSLELWNSGRSPWERSVRSP